MRRSGLAPACFPWAKKVDIHTESANLNTITAPVIGLNYYSRPSGGDESRVSAMYSRSSVLRNPARSIS